MTIKIKLTASTELIEAIGNLALALSGKPLIAGKPEPVQATAQEPVKEPEPLQEEPKTTRTRSRKATEPVKESEPEKEPESQQEPEPEPVRETTKPSSLTIEQVRALVVKKSQEGKRDVISKILREDFNSTSVTLLPKEDYSEFVKQLAEL